MNKIFSAAVLAAVLAVTSATFTPDIRIIESYQALAVCPSDYTLFSCQCFSHEGLCRGSFPFGGGCAASVTGSGSWYSVAKCAKVDGGLTVGTAVTTKEVGPYTNSEYGSVSDAHCPSGYQMTGCSVQQQNAGNGQNKGVTIHSSTYCRAHVSFDSGPVRAHAICFQNLVGTVSNHVADAVTGAGSRSHIDCGSKYPLGCGAYADENGAVWEGAGEESSTGRCFAGADNDLRVQAWGLCLTFTDSPTSSPTSSPTGAPTQFSADVELSVLLTLPTDAPTLDPTNAPTLDPTVVPTSAPTGTPTAVPTSSCTASRADDPSLGCENVYDDAANTAWIADKGGWTMEYSHEGHCRDGYYAGWDGLATGSQADCNALCLSESQCTYAAFLPGQSCSRYSAAACPHVITTTSIHTTYTKVTSDQPQFFELTPVATDSIKLSVLNTHVSGAKVGFKDVKFDTTLPSGSAGRRRNLLSVPADSDVKTALADALKVDAADVSITSITEVSDGLFDVEFVVTVYADTAEELETTKTTIRAEVYSEDFEVGGFYAILNTETPTGTPTMDPTNTPTGTPTVDPTGAPTTSHVVNAAALSAYGAGSFLGAHGDIVYHCSDGHEGCLINTLAERSKWTRVDEIPWQAHDAMVPIDGFTATTSDGAWSTETGVIVFKNEAAQYSQRFPVACDCSK